jgi:hypothetical protein
MLTPGRKLRLDKESSLLFRVEEQSGQSVPELSCMGFEDE